MSSPSPHRSQRFQLFSLSLVVFIDVMGFSVGIPLLPLYAEHLHARPMVAALLVPAYAICQLIAGPILGNLSDKYGRRPLLMVSQCGTLIGFLMLAYANSLWMLFIGRILDGITAGNLVIAQAYLSDITTPQNRAKSFGIIGIAFGVGFVAGPTLVGLLQPYGFHVPFLVAASLSALSILATYLLLPEVRKKPENQALKRLGVWEVRGYLAYFSRPQLTHLLVQFLCFTMAFSLFTSGFAMFAERRFIWDGNRISERGIAFMYAYLGVLGILIQGSLGRLIKKMGEWKLITMGFAFCALGYALLGFNYTVWGFGIIAIIAAFGQSVIRPALTSQITQAVATHEQGVVLGVTQTVASISMAAASTLSGVFIELSLLSEWAWLAALFCLAGFLVGMRNKVDDRALFQT